MQNDHNLQPIPAASPVSSTTSSGPLTTQAQLDRMAAFYGEDPDYNPYDKPSLSPKQQPTAARPQQLSAVQTPPPAIPTNTTTMTPPQSTNATASTTPMVAVPLRMPNFECEENLVASTTYPNSYAVKQQEQGAGGGGGGRSTQPVSPAMPYKRNTTSLLNGSSGSVGDGGFGHRGDGGASLQSNLDNASFDETATNYNGNRSVSVANGSVANSADLGVFADLDVFTHHRHDPYSTVGTEGGWGHQQQQPQSQQHHREQQDFGHESASAATPTPQPSYASYRQPSPSYSRADGGGGGRGRGVPSFEQADRFVAEFYQYQEEQAGALAYYNQQRDQLAGYNRSGGANNNHFGGGGSGTGDHQPHNGNGNDNNTNYNNRDAAAMLNFASDVLPVYPEDLASEPAAKKKGGLQQANPAGQGGRPHHLHNTVSANNDNDNATAAASPHTADQQHAHHQQEMPPSAVTSNVHPTPYETVAAPNNAVKPKREKFRMKMPTPLQAMRGNIGPAFVSSFVSAVDADGHPVRKGRKQSRFMPPPPPSLQAARVMAVCAPAHNPAALAPGDAYYGGPQAKQQTIAAIAAAEAKVHAADHKTCRAEGDFAFLTKTPHTADWSQGYGASYSATVAEGAPGATFAAVDVAGAAFQSYLQVLMQWYSRVARVFGHNDPRMQTAWANAEKIAYGDGGQQAATVVGQVADTQQQTSSSSQTPSSPVVVKNSFLRPIAVLPDAYFGTASVPPCPRPEVLFEVTPDEVSGLLVVSDMQRFVLWHDAIQLWWEHHVQPRSVGYALHAELVTEDHRRGADDRHTTGFHASSKKVGKDGSKRTAAKVGIASRAAEVGTTPPTRTPHNYNTNSNAYQQSAHNQAAQSAPPTHGNFQPHPSPYYYPNAGMGGAANSNGGGFPPYAPHAQGPSGHYGYYAQPPHMYQQQQQYYEGTQQGHTARTAPAHRATYAESGQFPHGSHMPTVSVGHGQQVASTVVGQGVNSPLSAPSFQPKHGVTNSMMMMMRNANRRGSTEGATRPNMAPPPPAY